DEHTLTFVFDGPIPEGNVNIAGIAASDKWGRSVPRVEDDARVGRLAASATIGDFVWNDENADGIQDADEKGIAGAKVKLTLPDGTTQEAVTNANGLYLFSGLAAGEYTAELILSSIPAPPEGDNKITTAKSFTVDLVDDQQFLTADFGVVAELPKTGITADLFALAAMALLLAGTGILLVVRKPEDEDDAVITA
ncbi:MAG: SdrD B-like domain-containing protein, partial [Actinomycetota bacterium]